MAFVRLLALDPKKTGGSFLVEFTDLFFGIASGTLETSKLDRRSGFRPSCSMAGCKAGVTHEKLKNGATCLGAGEDLRGRDLRDATGRVGPQSGAPGGEEQATG